MKVVLFCGGQGTRIRDYSTAVPKPMVPVGYRPILWHIMKYYAHFGHTDFILALGYQADVIKNYFLHYNEFVSNDFVLSEGGKKLELFTSDISDWKITFVDTGMHACVGERLMAVRKHVQDEEVFMANYADGVTDLDLDLMVDHFHRHDRTASFLAAHPNYSFHIVDSDRDGIVRGLVNVRQTGMRINGGFFIFKQEIFDYMREGEELVEEPFQRLAASEQLVSFDYDGFFACMDTFKEQRQLEEMYTRGEAPWVVWNAEERHHRPVKVERPNLFSVARGDGAPDKSNSQYVV